MALREQSQANGATTDWSLDVPARWAPLVSDFGLLAHDAEPHMVAMRDSVRLATDVYLPDPLRGRVPAVLMRTCYDKSGPLMDLPEVARRLNAEGYVVVVQDVRGRFRSEGARTPFLYELEDGYDTLDWIVAQSWSDGAVGMLGTSYMGFAQWAAAASGHPALRALSVAVTSQVVPPAWWSPQIASPGGTEWLVSEWSCAARLEGEVLDWTRRPFADVVPTDLGNARRLLAELRGLASDPARLQRWAFPNGLPAASLSVPTLHAGGWWDLVKTLAMKDWDIASAHSPAADDQFLLMAAADHIGRRYGDDEDGMPTEPGLGIPLEPSIAFFHRYLSRRGEGARPLPRVRYETGNAGWTQAGSWPPEGSAVWTLHLADAGPSTSSLLGGSLSAKADRKRGVARWIHDPSAPVPSLGFDLVRPIAHEAAVHMRPDVATFTSDPVRQPVDIVGPVVAMLNIESSAPSTHVIATLIDLAPDGVVHQLVEGIAAVETLHGPARAVVELGPTAFRLPPGHRLRLAVSSSRFPTYLPHPGTNEDVWTAVDTSPARQLLRTGGGLGSALHLPVRRVPAG